MKQKQKRYTEEQIIRILKAHEAGAKVSDLIREHGLSEQRFYRWKSKYGGMEVSEARRLKDFEAENTKLKKLLAEAELDKAMLQAEGHVVNPKRTYRVYSELGMQVRTRRRKKLVRPRIPMVLPNRPNERWSMDFVHDQLADGRRFGILNIVDDYSRVCVGQIVDLSISGERLARYLGQSTETRGLPKSIVLDNGPEMTSKAMFFWSQRTRVKQLFIQPGKPTQNAFVVSFNGKFRDGCLNQHWFTDLPDVKQIIEHWRDHYNHERPHSSLHYMPPAIYENPAA